MNRRSSRSDATTEMTLDQRRPLIIPVFLPHMGCPHQCLFCNQKSITSRPDKMPPLESISDQIERFLAYNQRQRPFTEVSFYGGNFLGLAPHQIMTLLGHVSKFVERGRINGIRFSTRPDTIDPERLELIAPFPVSTIELGVQSMNDRVLAMSCRGHGSSETQSAAALLKQTDYTIGLQLMIGLPGDTTADLMESAHRIAALKPDFIRIYPTLVLEGSPLAGLYRNGKYSPLSLSQAVEQAKALYLLFQRENIAVIRMGLQASEELNQCDTVLAGPYHPAFGHMVFSSIYLDAMRRMLSHLPRNHNGHVQISVNPRDISKAQGIKKQNPDLLLKEFNLTQLKIVQDPCLPGCCLSVDNGESIHHIY